MRTNKFAFLPHTALIDQTGLTNTTRESWALLRDEINRFTDGWIACGQECLKTNAERARSVNVLVADAQLGYALSKVLAFGLGPSFPIENIYSSSKIGKEQCFQRIRDRYGKKNTYIVVGDGPEEEDAAKSVSARFRKSGSLWTLKFRVKTLDSKKDL